MVLSDQHAVIAKQFRFVRPKIEKDKCVIRVVGRIVKCDIPSGGVIAPSKILCGQGYDLRFRLVDTEEVEIFFYQSARATRLVDERYELGPARKSFDADGAGSGAEVEQAGVLADPRRENIKECFAKPVGGRPRPTVGGALQNTASILTGDNAHRENAECGTRSMEYRTQQT